MKNDKEVVKVYVDNLEDIFNKFDNNDISDELANYIEQRCSRTAKNSMDINIITKEELDNEQKDKLVTAIRSHYGLENKYLGIEIKKLNNANILYFIIGIMIIFVANILPIGKFIPEVIDILGGFIIYESAFNLLFIDNELDLKSYRNKKIEKAHIKFEIKKPLE